MPVDRTRSDQPSRLERRRRGRDGFVEPRTVDVHVARLRAKFLAAKLPPPEVETVRGIGYRFRESSRVPSSKPERYMDVTPSQHGWVTLTHERRRRPA